MIEEKNDLWQYLASTDKPIAVYGMGDGADKLACALEGIGRQADDYFASDGFVRGQSFRGKTVLSFDSVRNKYKNGFIILLSFGTHLPDVIKAICDIDREYELYAPDLPVCPDDLFTYAYYKEHKDGFDHARSLLCDDESRREFDDVLNFKLSGKLKYIKFSQNSQFEVAKQELKCYNYISYIDGGAYNGDSVLFMANECPNLRTVYAFEPDSRSFRKLSAIQLPHTVRMDAVNAALGDFDGVSEVFEKGNRNTSLYIKDATGVKTKTVRIATVDGVLNGERADLIKLDVEGAESAALDGAVNTISRYAPDLSVSLYHRPSDMFTLIPKVYSMYDAPVIRVRKSRYIPAWDFNMYLTKR